MFENGCEILRIDFHLHTRKDKEFKYNGENDNYISEYINGLEKQKINIGVITNHNKFDLDEYKALKRAGKKKQIFILPGVELSVKEGSNGVHTLIVFNPDEWLSNGENYIDSFLTAAFLNIPNRENENTRCNYDIPNTIKTLESMGKDYFIVFAHIEQNSGFIKECQGGLITSLSQQNIFRKRVLGFQKLRTVDNIAKLKQWMGYEIAYVEGSDPKCIEEIGKGTKASFIKIGNFSFYAVKYALQDFRNRMFCSLSNNNHGYIESVSFVGGRLDGVTVRLSPELNTLIGIRGSGKSSILEAIRYTLDLPAIMDKEYKDDLIKNVLGSGGQVTIKVIDKYSKHYEIRRIMNEIPSILDDAGNDLAISVHSVLNNPLYFGQKDLSFTNKGYELDLLQKLVGNKIESTSEMLISYQSDLVEAIRQLIGVTTIPSQIEELETENKDIQHKLQVFKEKGVAEKLTKQTSYNSDLLKIQSIANGIQQWITVLDAAFNGIDQKEIDVSSYVSEYNNDIFDEVRTTNSFILEIFSSIKESIISLKEKKQNIENISIELSKKVDSLKEEFAAIKREIQDDTIDPDSFVKYTSDFEKNQSKINKLKKQCDSRNTLITQIKKSIRERNEALNAIYNAYLNEIDKINKSQKELLINIDFKGDKTKFKSDIKSSFRGTGISDIKAQTMSEIFSDFVSIVEDYFIFEGKELHKILTDGEFAKVSEKILSNYAQFINIECPNSVSIFYHKKPLDKHSIGQRASALILFILTQQDNDIIIIDQPEDDLDNQVIYKEVINTIKEKKPYIQFIFATHNANIPVLGDAESIIATSYQDDKIMVDIGNIDCPNTHTKIVDIMEGGKEAFDKRKLIYTTWK